MTEQLFQQDSYLKRFECRVLEVDENKKTLVVDRTAFFPGGGGQVCDLGVFENGEDRYPVVKVKRTGGKLLHYLEDKMPEVGSALAGEVDWDRRYKAMRTHTAMHILCGVVWRDYGAQVTGGDMDLLKGRMDFEFENFSKELVEEIEEKVNLEVAAGRKVRVAILEREEAFRIPDLIRTKINLLPESIRQVRTVEIVGLDLQADGGTHVANTSEVGTVRVVDYKSKGKNNKRIYIELEDVK